MEATTTAELVQEEEEERWKLARKAPHLHSHTDSRGKGKRGREGRRILCQQLRGGGTLSQFPVVESALC